MEVDQYLREISRHNVPEMENLIYLHVKFNLGEIIEYILSLFYNCYVICNCNTEDSYISSN